MSSPQAFISFEDAIYMRNARREKFPPSVVVDLFGDRSVEFSTDSADIDADFGFEVSYWVGKVHEESTLFGQLIDPMKSCSNICIQMSHADWIVSLSIDQSCKVQGDFIRSDIRVFHGGDDVTNFAFNTGVAVGTKENMKAAMLWCHHITS
jgi:hypothetical protein